MAKGADDFVIRTVIDYNSGWDNKAELMVFLQDMRQQALRSAEVRDPAVTVDPNSWRKLFGGRNETESSHVMFLSKQETLFPGGEIGRVG